MSSVLPSWYDLDLNTSTRVLLALGQSETTRLFKTGPYFSQGEYPALAAQNVTVVVGPANHGGEGPRTVVLDQAAVDAREVAPAMVALANLWHEARPGEMLWVLDGTVSGTSFASLVDDDSPARSFSDLEAVVGVARAAGLEVDDVVWNWYNSTASGWRTFGESNAPGLLAQTWDGADYDLAVEPWDHSLFDAGGAFEEYGDGLFSRALTRLSVMGPGPSPQPGMDERVNFTHEADGALVRGRSQQLDRGALEAGAAFMADPRLGPAAGANGPSPVVVKFGDYEGGERLAGGDTAIHPSNQSIHGSPYWAMHVGAAALIASGEATEPSILGQRTSPDGLRTEVVVDLGREGVLSTMRQVTGHVSPEPSPAPHQHAIGTGFELRLPGRPDAERRPVEREGTPGEGPKARIAVLDDGSGAAPGEARTATIELVWSQPVPDGAVLEYLRGGEFSAQITAADYDRELWADLLLKHVPEWHDGTAFGYPGIPVRPQPAVDAMTLGRGASTVPGDGGVYAPTDPVEPPDRAPAIEPLSDAELAEEGRFAVEIVARDPDGDPVALSATIRGTDGAPDPAPHTLLDRGDGTGQLVWDAPAVDADATFQVTVEARAGGLSDRAVFGLTVRDAAPPPPPAAPGEALFRVNAGGGRIAADDGGPDWAADMSASPAGHAPAGEASPHLVLAGGQVDLTRGTTGVARSDDAPAAVFATNRFGQKPGPAEFGYSFDVAPGEYVVRLHLAEWWTGAAEPGTRLMDVSVEGALRLDDFDIAQTFGLRTPGTIDLATTVTDGTLDLTLASVARQAHLNALEILGAGGTGGPDPQPNRAPVPSSLDAVEARVGEAVSVDLSGAFTDPDGDALTFAASSLPPGFALSPTGVLTGTASAPGTASVEITARDPGGLSASLAVEMTVADAPDPEPPLPPATGALVFEAADIRPFQGRDQDSPEDGGAGVTVSADGSAVELHGNLWKEVSVPTFAIGVGTRISVDVEIGEVRPELVLLGLQPAGGWWQSGDATVWQLGGAHGWSRAMDLRGGGTDLGSGVTRYEIDLGALAGREESTLILVSDDDRASNGLGSARFSNVTILDGGPPPPPQPNRAPVAEGFDDVAAVAGRVLSLDLAAGFSDPDGDALDFTTSPLPDGLGLDAGVISGTVAAPGSFEVTATARDGEGLFAEASFTVTVAEPGEGPPDGMALAEAYREGPGIGSGAPIREAAGYTRGKAGPEIFVLGETRADVSSGAQPDVIVVAALSGGREHKLRALDGDVIDLRPVIQAAAFEVTEVVQLQHYVWNGRAQTGFFVDVDGGGDDFEREILVAGLDPNLTAQDLVDQGLLVVA